jgi:phage-related baseplate assembly protein
MALPVPEFFERDVAEIVAEMIAYYEAETGKTLQPAQPERLVINMFAYRELVLRNALNDAAKQNLVAFSRYPVLDYLGQLVGVTRLPASEATCTLSFELVPGHGQVVIPEGTRASTQDGTVVFATIEDVTVPVGVDKVEVTGKADVAGALGNGFLAGNVTTIIDVQPFLDTVENMDVTSGGSDEETDEQLRERIKIAPEAFSNAGSRGAYRFHASSAHPTIIDVAVVSPTPGTVEIYPLSTAGIPTPTPILDAVFDACNDEKIRPLTDTVNVLSPVNVPYNIEVNVTLYSTANQQLVEDAINEALEAYAEDKGKKLGRDIMRAQIAALCVVDGVYNVSVAQPVSNIILNESSFGEIGTITVNIVGFNNG